LRGPLRSELISVGGTIWFQVMRDGISLFVIQFICFHFSDVSFFESGQQIFDYSVLNVLGRNEGNTPLAENCNS